KTLGQTGITAGTFKEQDPQGFANLLKQSGMTEFQLAQALAAEGKSQLKTDTKILGDTAYASIYNPATNKFETHVQQFDLPDGSLVDFGNGKIMKKSIGADGQATYTDALPK